MKSRQASAGIPQPIEVDEIGQRSVTVAEL